MVWILSIAARCVVLLGLITSIGLAQPADMAATQRKVVDALKTARADEAAHLMRRIASTDPQSRAMVTLAESLASVEKKSKSQGNPRQNRQAVAALAEVSSHRVWEIRYSADQEAAEQMSDAQARRIVAQVADILDESYFAQPDWRAFGKAALEHMLGVTLASKELRKRFPGLEDGETGTAFAVDVKQVMVEMLAKPELTRQQIVDAFGRTLGANGRSIKLPAAILLREFCDAGVESMAAENVILWQSDLRKASLDATHGTLGLMLKPTRGYPIVVAVDAGGPAERARISPGEAIIEVNGLPIYGQSPLPGGIPGKTIDLSVKDPDGQTRQCRVEYAATPPDCVNWNGDTADNNWLVPQTNIGYVRIRTFGTQTTDSLAKVLSSLKDCHARSLIIDLRANLGGIVTHVADAAGLFTDAAVIAEIRADRATRYGRWSTRAQTHVVSPTIPIAILVDEMTSAGAELFAMVLREQRGAVTIGQQTRGSGKVQMLFPLMERKGVLKLTTSRLYTATGTCIDRNGVGNGNGLIVDIPAPASAPRPLHLVESLPQADPHLGVGVIVSWAISAN